MGLDFLLFSLLSRARPIDESTHLPEATLDQDEDALFAELYGHQDTSKETIKEQPKGIFLIFYFRQSFGFQVL